MKKFSILVLMAMMLHVFYSCSNGNGKTSDNNGNSSTKNIALPDSTKTIKKVYLEDLLNIKSEVELKQKFVPDRVKYDTVWGMEGNFEMGTCLDKGTKNELQITWKDSATRSTITLIQITATTDKDGNYIFENQWESKSGIKLGMTTNDLEKLNGKSFSFSGFGWDYGGGVMGWNDGKLEKLGLSVTLSEGNSWASVSEKERDQIMGDQTVKSDNAVVKKLQPKVVQISVYTPQ